MLPPFTNCRLDSYLHLYAPVKKLNSRKVVLIINSQYCSESTTNVILLVSEGSHRSRTRLLGKIPSVFTLVIRTGFKIAIYLPCFIQSLYKSESFFWRYTLD